MQPKTEQFRKYIARNKYNWYETFKKDGRKSWVRNRNEDIRQIKKLKPIMQVMKKKQLYWYWYKSRQNYKTIVRGWDHGRKKQELDRPDLRYMSRKRKNARWNEISMSG